MTRSSSEERIRRGRYLRAARERAGMTQDYVADLLEYEKGSIVAHWENGRRDPSLVNLRALAEIYRVPLSLLMEPPPSELDVIEDAVLRQERAAVVRALEPDESDPEVRRYVRRWAAEVAPTTLRRVDHPPEDPVRG